MSRSRGVGTPSSTAATSSDDQEEGVSADEEFDALSHDDVFEILSNRRRRFTLHHLQRNVDRAELGELSEHVAAWENGTPVDGISSAERKRVYTSLQQFHLPKLDSKGVVDFDDRAGVVELTDTVRDLDIYLEVVDGNDIPWSQYYLGLAAVNLGLLVAALVGTYPLTLISGFGWGIFTATSILVSALVHTYLSSTAMRLGDTERPPEAKPPAETSESGA
jgi:hypothetical protein